MNLLTVAACVLQMTIVMLAAGLIARWLRQHAPGPAASVGLGGLLSSLILVGLALFNAPRPFETRVTAGSKSAVATHTQEVASSDSRESSRTFPVTQPDDARPSMAMSLGGALRWLGSQRIDTGTQSRSLPRWRNCLVLLVISVALLPIFVGLIGTVQLHRRSKRMSDDELEMLRSRVKLNEITSLSFRHSEMIHAPCVTVFGGGVIYLPCGWATWSDDELSAAIVHEAAHLRRRDPWIRLMGQLSVSIQFFHPLAFWLSRSIVLSQEMAADRAAADALGDEYVKNLSRLALRIDNDCEISSRRSVFTQFLMRPGIVSVSSSHLIRRIEMLTSHSVGCTSRKLALLSQFVLLGLFVTCASWTVRADPPTDGPPQEAEAVNESPPRIARLPNQIADENNVPFSQPRFAPWDTVRKNETGYFAVRVDRLQSHPVIEVAVPTLVEPVLDQLWPMIATDAAAEQRADLGLTLGNLEHVIGSLTFVFSNEPPKQEDEDAIGNCTASSDGTLVRFKKPVAHDPLKAALDFDKIARICEEGGVDVNDLGGKTMTEFVDLMLSPMFTDGATTSELLLQPKEKEFSDAQFARLQRAWNVVDGGTIAACYVMPSSLGYVASENDKLGEAILVHAAVMSVGVDYSSALEPTHLRVAFVPREDVSVAELEAVVRKSLDTAEEFTESKLNDPDAKVVEYATKARGVLESRHVEAVSSSDDVESDCVMLTVRVPLDSFVLFADF